MKKTVNGQRPAPEPKPASGKLQAQSETKARKVRDDQEALLKDTLEEQRQNLVPAADDRLDVLVKKVLIQQLQAEIRARREAVKQLRTEITELRETRAEAA